MTPVDFALAIIAGIVVLAIWIPLDSGWVSFDLGQGFDPRHYQSERIDWTITAFRLLGLVIVVPIAEELFWRSFLMRWIADQAFMSVEPARVGARACDHQRVVRARAQSVACRIDRGLHLRLDLHAHGQIMGASDCARGHQWVARRVHSRCA